MGTSNETGRETSNLTGMRTTVKNNGLRRMQEVGINEHLWNLMMSAPEHIRRQVFTPLLGIESLLNPTSGIVYDANVMKDVLGRYLNSFSMPDRSAPVPEPGEIVVYYGGWSFDDLARATCTMEFSKLKMHANAVGHSYEARDGYYRLRFDTATQDLVYRRQVELVPSFGENWKPAIGIVVATALIICLVEDGGALIPEGEALRCVDQIGQSTRLVLRSERRGLEKRPYVEMDEIPNSDKNPRMRLAIQKFEY